MLDRQFTHALNAALCEADQTPDSELLRRFVATRDDTAFELLLRRHADLVWKVCRAVLRDDLHAAEDAFQASFIALAQQARAISQRELLAAWLFRVARHAALRTRKRSLSRSLEPLPIDVPAPASFPDISAEVAEQAAMVAEEVDRLPPRYRDPVILCFYQGYTHVQAALRLGWAVGTVASRVARAKDWLRNRLTNRGVVLSIPLGAALTVPVEGAMNPALIRACVLATIDTTAVPVHILSISKEVLSAMRPVQPKWVFAAVLLAGGLATGAILNVGVAKPSPTAEPAEPAKVEVVDPVSAPNGAAQPKQPTVARAIDRAESQRYLALLAQAIRHYQTDHGHLPTDIVDKNGKALLSWRVVILPFINQSNVYKIFKLDEPWDSDANKRGGQVLIKTFLAAIKDPPVNPDGYGLTLVKRFTGPNTLHRPGESVDLNTAPWDRQGMTLLLAEVGDPIPWTKPDDPVITPAAKDKPFTPKNPPLWAGPYSNVVNVAFLDGHALSLKPDLSAETVASLIYWNDAKVLPKRDELIAAIPPKQEAEDIKELLQTLRQKTDEIVKLSEEEIKLRSELMRLKKSAEDPATHLAREVLEMDWHLLLRRNDLRNLREAVEKAKKP
jgi:RNA polymerase sigma factor (sigma-70 family)